MLTTTKLKPIFTHFADIAKTHTGIFLKHHKYNIIFLFALITQVCLMSFAINDYSISYEESVYFFDSKYTTLHFISNFFTNLFGVSDFHLRLGFLTLYTFSSILFYEISKIYLNKRKDALFCVFIFMLTPGITSAGILVNIAIIIVFGVLLFVYMYHINKPISYAILLPLGFISPIFSILFISIFAYSIKSKNIALGFISLCLGVVFLPNNAFIASGLPQGYFLDVLGKYSSAYSPILFFYILYCFFKTFFKKNKDIIWYIVFTPLIVGLILSIRQDINISHFATYFVLGILIGFREFMHSFRIRLQFNRKYHFLFGVLLFLFLSLLFAGLHFSKTLYEYIPIKEKNFAYDYHIAKDLAIKLQEISNKHNIKIDNIKVESKSMNNRLKFYLPSIGTNIHTKYKLFKQDIYKQDKLQANNTSTINIPIKYHNILVAKFILVKTNN